MTYNDSMDKELDNIPIQECDWKVISTLNLSYIDIEKLFGKIPEQYKYLFNGRVA